PAWIQSRLKQVGKNITLDAAKLVALRVEGNLLAAKQEIDKLVKQAKSLKDSPTKVNLLESAIQIADACGDIEEGFWIRKSLIEAATFSGCVEKALIAFPWCLAKCEQEPDKFSEKSLLWEYKWICEHLPNFPQISREQIQNTLSDFAQRYQKWGSSMRPFFRIQCMSAVKMNDTLKAKAYYQKWQETPKDRYTACRACELDDKLDYIIYIGEYEKAIVEATPILQGKLSCTEVPQFTLAKLLLPLVKLERIHEAVKYHRKNVRMISQNRDFLQQIGEHLTFLVITNNLIKAVELLEKHLIWALESLEPYMQFYFYQSVIFLTQVLLDRGETNIKLRLPNTFPLYSENGEYSTIALNQWFTQVTEDIALKFDRRNGNNYYFHQIEELKQLKALITNVSIN
ncbi:MAG: hypothetical protein AAF378_05735, partial [Cyanobacteria bacterium P01_A01_bin.84]